MRPHLHFTAESGWINDPHGLTWHDGAYHLFHQFVPDSMEWAPNCHWGHAVGRDLLTWERRPVAIAPGDGDDGIWTGSLVAEDGTARILYTSVVQPDIGIGRVRVAVPTDDTWDGWTKGDVLVEAPDDLDLIAYRDPFVLREGDGWRMFVGAADRAGTAMALTYTSTDLTDWAYDGVAASRSTDERSPVWMGALWECPQFFEVDGRWVMVSSIWDDDVLHYAGYAIGSYADGRFEADTWGRLSFGDSYYAPSFFRDRDGRPCLMFWMRGVRDDDAGWSSCLSVPHVLSVVGERLVATPHPDLDARRGREAVDGDQVIDAEWAPHPGGDRLVLTAGDLESAAVSAADGVVRLDRPGCKTTEMPWTGGALRVVVDGPTIEISSLDGVLGGPITPLSTVLPVAGELRAWKVD
ncbi:glycoside hydrolase family 32 protein [Isoptericola sp. b408]|uniref:glycoside hydrolase family 32 protein n=1 Tax=Isoptericola sp. b408 TaxID=3064653 RepID=UPI0027126BC8|nr:glycoside hydrolase family 32 protein [Isoptericola sp. b408]MDO8150004.1 glycoside hydrolase family 32 protein [Isoptericola sp. b408]